MAVTLAPLLMAILRARHFLGRLVGSIRHEAYMKLLLILIMALSLFLSLTPLVHVLLLLSTTEVLGMLSVLLRILIPSLPLIMRSMAGGMTCALCLCRTAATDRLTVLLPEVLTLSVPSIVMRILLLTLRQLWSTLMQSAVTFINPVR